jgi:hypothetical protein
MNYSLELGFSETYVTIYRIARCLSVVRRLQSNILMFMVPYILVTYMFEWESN